LVGNVEKAKTMIFLVEVMWGGVGICG